MQDQITIYETPDWKVKIWVLFEEENLWLSQKLMAELFETTPQNITLHLWNIYNEKELEEKSTCKDFLQVQKEWNREVKRNTLNPLVALSLILSLGLTTPSIRFASKNLALPYFARLLAKHILLVRG